VRIGGADLTDANFASADLTSAYLFAANFTRANFDGANLTDARWPATEPVPEEGWMWDGESGRLKRAGQLSEVTDHYLW